MPSVIPKTMVSVVNSEGEGLGVLVEHLEWSHVQREEKRCTSSFPDTNHAPGPGVLVNRSLPRVFSEFRLYGIPYVFLFRIFRIVYGIALNSAE